MILCAAPVAVTIAMLAQAGWSASAGTEQFSYRDVSRNGPPADASPVSWDGSGPSITVVHDSGGKQLHRVTFDIASAGRFAYVGPERRVAASSGDGALRIEWRYEYRRYPFRNLLVKGLDAGVGVEGAARRLSLTRDVAAGRATNVSLGAAVACVAAARLHRWGRWNAEVMWTNGISVLRQHERYAADPLATVDEWGGGWLTDLAVSGRVMLTRHASLVGSWLDTGEGTTVMHHSFTFGRRRIVAGVMYAR